VVLFETRLQALQNLDRLLDRGLDHVDLLETARQRRVFFEDAAVLGEGGRTDALHRTRAERGLEQVARVERAARGRTGADQRVDLVDEEHGVRLVLQVLEHTFQTLLEVTTVLGAGQQSAHVERVHDRVGKDLGHFVLRDAPGQAFCDGGLAHTGLTDQQRIVLAPAAKNLDHTLDFEFAPDQRIDLAVAGQLVEVLGELVERRAFAVAVVFLTFATTAAAFVRLR